MNEKRFSSFEEAREFVRKLGLKSSIDWWKYCKFGNKPQNIPSAPYNVYKNKGWIDWSDWTGNGKKPKFKGKYRSFEEAREFVRKLGLKSTLDWWKYCKFGNKPQNIPFTPGSVYKGKGWKGFSDWLGSKYLTFEEAREFVRKLGLKYQSDWWKYCTSGKKPNNIPSCPHVVYKNKGWSGISDWLGKAIILENEFSS